jgi:hypothetical protein
MRPTLSSVLAQGDNRHAAVLTTGEIMELSGCLMRETSVVPVPSHDMTTALLEK